MTDYPAPSINDPASERRSPENMTVNAMFPLGILPNNTFPNNKFPLPLIKAMEEQCNSQRARISGSVQTVSVFGTVMIAGFSLFFICIHIFLACFAQRILRKLGYADNQSFAFQVADEKLQLVRMALDREDCSIWERGKNDVPVTTTNTLFAPPVFHGGLPRYWNPSADAQNVNLNGTSILLKDLPTSTSERTMDDTDEHASQNNVTQGKT